MCIRDSKYSGSTHKHRGAGSRGSPLQASSQHACGQGGLGPRSSPAPVAHMHSAVRPSAQLSPPLAGAGAAHAGGRSMPRSRTAAEMAAGGSGSFGVSAVSGLSGNLPEMQETSGISAVGASGPSTVGSVPRGGLQGDRGAASATQRRLDRRRSTHSSYQSADIQMGLQNSGGGDFVCNHKLPESRKDAMAICRQLERQHMQVGSICTDGFHALRMIVESSHTSSHALWHT